MANYYTYDCHVMLRVFLLIVIRAIGIECMKMVIRRMSYFFNSITQKVIDEAELLALKPFIAETLCQFEICFPLFYIDIMLNLMIHMVDHIQELSPVYLHQMWTNELFMLTLKIMFLMVLTQRAI